jgi:hypothetical protein
MIKAKQTKSMMSNISYHVSGAASPVGREDREKTTRSGGESPQWWTSWVHLDRPGGGCAS